MRYGVGLVLLSLTLTGCGSPESGIKESCVRDGGLGFADSSPEQIRRQCGCYADRLKQMLPAEDLERVAEAMKLPKEKQKDAISALPMRTNVIVVVAGQHCR